MKVLIFILAIAIMTQSFADCTLGDGTVLKEGEDSSHKSLFDEGGKLASQPTTDQDDLATCYAVSSTTALKTVLPGSPDISYHHAAIKQSLEEVHHRVGGGAVRFEGYGRGHQESVVDYGTVCSTIKALKNAGGACPKAYSALESHPGTDPKLQGRIQHGLGKYFDYLNAHKNDTIKMQELKDGIDEVLKAIQKEKTEGKIVCQQTFLPAGNGLRDFIYDNAFEEMAYPCPARKEAIKKMTTSPVKTTIIGFPDRMKIEPNPDFIGRMENFLSLDPELNKDVQAYLNSTSNPSPQLSVKFTAKMAEFLNKEFPPESMTACRSMLSTLVQSPHPLLYSGSLDPGKKFLDFMRAEKASTCQSTAAQSLKVRAHQECHTTQTDLIVDALEPLVELGESIDRDKVLNFLTNPAAEGASQLEAVLLKECPGHLVSLEGVTCEPKAMCNDPAIRTLKSEYYTGAQNCPSLTVAKNKFSKEAIDGIKNNRAVNVSICTGFLDNPGLKTGFCQKKNVNSGAAHAFHAITLTGYRCNGGKVQYELLNSWGKACPGGSEGDNPAFECVRDIPAFTACMAQPNAVKVDCQRTTSKGRFWVGEDQLVENTMSVVSIKGGGQ